MKSGAIALGLAVVVTAMLAAEAKKPAQPQAPKKAQSTTKATTTTSATTTTATTTKPPFYERYLTETDPVDVAIRQKVLDVRQHPGDPARHNDFGNLLARRGFTGDALAEYRKASRLDRHFYLADYNAGLLHEREGSGQRALDAYRRAVRRKPGFPEARFHLGLAYERQGNDSAAVEEYAKALRIDDSLRQPARNPLVVQSRLLYRVSLVNYRHDLAAADVSQARYAGPDPLAPVSTVEPVDAAELAQEDIELIEDSTEPKPIIGTPARPPRPAPAAGTPARPAAPPRQAPPANPYDQKLNKAPLPRSAPQPPPPPPAAAPAPMPPTPPPYVPPDEEPTTGDEEAPPGF
jgi:Flp pilus assembly protein TadD